MDRLSQFGQLLAVVSRLPDSEMKKVIIHYIVQLLEDETNLSNK
jgi:hypothetical protein